MQIFLVVKHFDKLINYLLNYYPRFDFQFRQYPIFNYNKPLDESNNCLEKNIELTANDSN